MVEQRELLSRKLAVMAGLGWWLTGGWPFPRFHPTAFQIHATVKPNLPLRSVSPEPSNLPRPFLTCSNLDRQLVWCGHTGLVWEEHMLLIWINDLTFLYYL